MDAVIENKDLDSFVSETAPRWEPSHAGRSILGLSHWASHMARTTGASAGSRPPTVAVEESSVIQEANGDASEKKDLQQGLVKDEAQCLGLDEVALAQAVQRELTSRAAIRIADRLEKDVPRPVRSPV